MKSDQGRPTATLGGRAEPVGADRAEGPRPVRWRQALVGVAFSSPAVAAGVGLLLAPSWSGLLILGCFVGVAFAAVRAEGARQRSRALLKASGVSAEFARAQWCVVRWLLLAVGLFVAAGATAAILN